MILLWCLLCAAAGLAIDVQAETPTDGIRLHFAWGGGQPRQWSGRVSLTHGRWRDERLLGVESDDPGSLQNYGQQILIQQKRPRVYNGFEVTALAPQGQLRVELLPHGEVRAHVIVVELDDFFEGQHNQPLDDSGNRLVIRRLPSDKIRVALPFEDMVFRPGQAFNARISAPRLSVPPETSLRCVMKLRRVGGETDWQQEDRERADSNGGWPGEEQIAFELPSEEGVYDFVVQMLTRRRTPPFRSELVAQRNVQLVIINETPPPLVTPRDQLDELVLELDPTEANWWQRLKRLPQWSLVPGFRSDGPLGNLKVETIERHDRQWTRMEVGGWQAYPLPISRVGEPHRLELDILGDVGQTICVSIVEANAAGKVLPVGIDAGVAVIGADTRPVATRPTTEARQQLSFWPRSKSPLLLISNLSNVNKAVYGKIRVYHKSFAGVRTARDSKQRTAFAYFEKPLFAEAFGATEALDARSGRSLEDWQTFYEGGRRLLLHLRDVGYGGAVIAAATEGSSLYPSQLLQPTPKHDRGLFFANGQDPVRKDVLKMLFYLCDREGIQLVPLVEFATPLPSLERIAQTGQGEGVRLVDNAGSSRLSQVPPRRGRAAYYNPLDSRVQRAMRGVIDELIHRYADHPSFAGVAISMHADGYTQLPGERWGADSRTWQRFCSESQLQASAERMTPQVRKAWLDWRCDQLGQLYTQIAADLAAKRSDARLYLAAARLIESRAVQRAFRPALPENEDVASAMREMALDPGRWRSPDNLVLMRPNLMLPALDGTVPSASVMGFNESTQVDDYFGQFNLNASQFLHEPYLKRLPSFDALSPFGKNNTFLSLVAQISQAGDQNRRRFTHALSTGDARVFFDGGWLLPQGQDSSLNPLLRVYHALPDRKFEDATNINQCQPLTVRTLTVADATYVYVVNDSPWHVGATVDLDAVPKTEFQPIGHPEAKVTVDNGQSLWTLSLKPYDLMAVKADQPDVRIKNVQVNLPPDVQPALESLIDKLAGRAALLGDPEPLPVPTNAGFERWSTPERSLDDWSVNANSGAVSATDDAQEGRQAIRIIAQDEVLELFSQPFAAPDSGRLSVSIQAKIPADRRQPRLRLVLRVNGDNYYPWSPLGMGAASRPLTDEWQEFVFRVNQLPPAPESLQIGFQVDGGGEVLVDNIQLFDNPVLDPAEQRELAHLLSLADRQRRVGQVSDCLRILQSYWPDYLARNVEANLEYVRQAPQPPVESAPADAPPPAPRAATTWQRLRRMFR